MLVAVFGALVAVTPPAPATPDLRPPNFERATPRPSLDLRDPFAPGPATTSIDPGPAGDLKDPFVRTTAPAPTGPAPRTVDIRDPFAPIHQRGEQRGDPTPTDDGCDQLGGVVIQRPKAMRRGTYVPPGCRRSTALRAPTLAPPGPGGG